MSASPMAKQTTESKAIPTKKVYFNEPSDLPSHYSSTPGGTLYSTTPGGTKIVYEKAFLLNLRNSPISKTPPSYGIPDSLMKEKSSPSYGIPDYLMKGKSANYNNSPPKKNNMKNRPPKRIMNVTVNKIDDSPHEDHQFQIDI